MSRIRIVASLIATLLVANVALLSARSGDGEPVQAGQPSQSRTPLPAGSGSAAPSVEPTTGEGPSSRPGQQPPPEGEVFPDLPFLPPEPGRYRYAKTTSVTDPEGNTDESTAVEVYDFRRWKADGNAVRQIVEVRERGSSAPEILVNEWRRAGVFRLERYVGGDGNSTCTYDPPQLVVPFPLREGSAFDAGSGRCAEAGPEPETSDGVETQESHRIVRTETVEISGEQVRCFVIEETTLTTFDTAQGKGRSESTTLKWFSPEYRLFLRIDVAIEGEFSGQGGVLNGAYSSESTRDLISLQPA